MALYSSAGYSARVNLELHLDNEILSVAKVGPERITLTESRSVPDGPAHLVITIGNTTKRQSVILNNSDPVLGTVNYW